MGKGILSYKAMVQEWHERRTPEAEGLRGNPAIWTVEYWAKVLAPCAEEDGDLTFENESVKVTHSKKKTFTQLFKKPHSRKNGYRTTEYPEQKRFPLETETADYEEALGGNEVASEGDDIALESSSAKVDKLEDVVDIPRRRG
ncbi:hypothetical protein AXG93_4134s1050 [Marchantia polymorpha subsp. ruderalis]|uniref:Uncharacterized protein n=1 Tax=Marchantia polymorpha subsp. ruderalis TaxID=1480154 RepID=A0A176VFW5_MARPO|nr:hypothetical protein AXG93_4134s1050 [Marchantia polymorpha subsp. ruderalis]